MSDMKKTLEHFKEMYLDEIKKITKKGELTPADGEAGLKALEALTMIDELCCKEDDKEMEMSMGYSERRHRNSLGQYTSRHGDDMKRNVVNKLEDMRMYDAPDNVTRRAIDRAINNIEENY